MSEGGQTIKMIMFDMDNTINNWDSRFYAEQIVKESGVDFRKVSEFTYPLVNRLDGGRINLAQFEGALAKKFAVPLRKIGYYDCYKRNVKADATMMGIVKRAKRRYTTALMTNSQSCRYGYTAKIVDLSLFDYRFVSGYTHLLKPSRKAYQHVLNVTGLRPDEILFIDNNIKNVKAARKLGINSIYFVGASKLQKELRSMKIL